MTSLSIVEQNDGKHFVLFLSYDYDNKGLREKT